MNAVEPPAGRRPGGPRRALDVAGSADHALLRAALDGPGARPGAGDRDLERARAAAAPARGRQRGARSLAVLREHDAGVRRCDMPRRARDARARALVGPRRARLPGGRRHVRERGTGRLGGRGRRLPRRLLRAADAAARGGRALRDGGLRPARPRDPRLVGGARRRGRGRERARALGGPHRRQPLLHARADSGQGPPTPK